MDEKQQSHAVRQIFMEAFSVGEVRRSQPEGFCWWPQKFARRRQERNQTGTIFAYREFCSDIPLAIAVRLIVLIRVRFSLIVADKYGLLIEIGPHCAIWFLRDVLAKGMLPAVAINWTDKLCPHPSSQISLSGSPSCKSYLPCCSSFPPQKHVFLPDGCFHLRQFYMWVSFKPILNVDQDKLRWRTCTSRSPMSAWEDSDFVSATSRCVVTVSFVWKFVGETLIANIKPPRPKCRG